MKSFVLSFLSVFIRKMLKITVCCLGMADQRLYFSLSKLSDDQIRELMDSVPTDDEATSDEAEGNIDSDDDSVEFGNYVVSGEDELASEEYMEEPVPAQPVVPSTSAEADEIVMPLQSSKTSPVAGTGRSRRWTERSHYRNVHR